MPSYRVELHSHSKGDPVDTHLSHNLIQHIDRAKEVGLHAIAITWHKKVCSDPKAYAYARERGVLLIPGMEADVDNRHVIILNLAADDLPGEPTWAQIRALRAHKPKVFVLAPHPFYPHPSCLGSIMNEHVDLIDAVEWCMIHVNWLPSRINPNLRAVRWAKKHGKPLVACSDAHTLTAIGKNPSTVEADELTIESIFDGIRAGRVSFHRKSLDFVPLVCSTSQAMSSQPRHIGRWVKAKWRSRNRGRLSSPSASNGAEALP